MKSKAIDKPGKHKVQEAKEATPSHTNGQGERAARTQQDKNKDGNRFPTGKMADGKIAGRPLPRSQVNSSDINLTFGLFHVRRFSVLPHHSGNNFQYNIE